MTLVIDPIHFHAEASPDLLGQVGEKNARTITDSPHAFMHFGDEETKKQAFMELLERQRRLLGTSKNGKK